MSQFQQFRRKAVPVQAALQLQAITLPAPMRGLHLDENAAFMQQGGALILDNWLPTLRGVKLRGGSKTWCTIPDAVPIVSSFEYVVGTTSKIFACQATKVWDVTLPAPAVPTLVKSGQNSGNYVGCQFSNAGGNWLTVANDFGDYLLQYDGTTWTTLNGGQLHEPSGGPVTAGQHLTYVWKYRGRMFFIQANSMNAWYLDIDSVVGLLHLIPLSGACTKGGKLLWGATWSLDAGDGLDDKCVFGTSEGEILIFTGTNPADAANWRQEGRFATAKPLGMNAHIQIGGDLLVATYDGIVPVSQAVTKDVAALQLASLTRPISQLWQSEVAEKLSKPWTMHKWDDFGGLLVTTPGGNPGSYRCFAGNTNTTAWCRITGWDAMCWMAIGSALYFGTQDGRVVQMETTGTDDGMPYTAVMVGAWEMFQQASSMMTWYQARAVFVAGPSEPFVPQMSAVTDFLVELPTVPNAAPDPGSGDYWDEGLWDTMLWDAAPPPALFPVRNTMWVSIGQTGFTHAPVLQVTIAQTVKPQVELIAITATYGQLGVNV